MHFAVNGRPVLAPPELERAVIDAYAELLPAGHAPLCVLNLTLPPEDVNPNVHPAKAVVALADLPELCLKVTAAVQSALGGHPLSRPLPELRAPAPASSAGQRRPLSGAESGRPLPPNLPAGRGRGRSVGHRRPRRPRAGAVRGTLKAPARRAAPGTGRTRTSATRPRTTRPPARTRRRTPKLGPDPGGIRRGAGTAADPARRPGRPAAAEAARADHRVGAGARRASPEREVLGRLACAPALKAGMLTPERGAAVLSQLAACDQPWACPHGRPTVCDSPSAT